jgi:hypothetical protein
MMRNEDAEDEDESEEEEKEAPPQYYGCVLCGAVTLCEKVGVHKDADDRAKSCDGELKKYPERYNRFVEDMNEEGLKVEHYSGRSYFNGPAVRIGQYEDEDEVIRATKVKLQRDSMGLGMILYPR